MATNTSPHPYRPDIDGLRGIAVLAVLMFHAFPGIMPGGFIGVDIFFVISGFLISGIILSSLDNGGFSTLGFYTRRVRRIFPALLLVLICGLVFGWFSLFSDEYMELGRQVVSSAWFVQNFSLFHDSGYFDRAAETKILLHLWSLAVEEQFYIVWPLFLVFFHVRRRGFLAVAVAAALISFAVNVHLSHANPSAAFYLPVPRFWELMIGGMLAYVSLYHPGVLASGRNIRAVLGFALIVVALLLLNNEREFPGYWALLPAAGAVLVISAGAEARLNRRLLGGRLLVWVGLISYPLYMWHWPLLAYLRIINPDGAGKELLAACALVLSVVLAWATYRFVELPLRHAGNAKAVAAVLCVFLLATSAVAALCAHRGGFPGRAVNTHASFAAEETGFDDSRVSDGSCERLNGETEVSNEVCHSNATNPEILFVGDSHAMALYSAVFEKTFPLPAMLISGHSCPIYPGVTFSADRVNRFGQNCAEISRKALAVAARYKSLRVVVVANSSVYVTLTEATYKKDGVGIDPQEAFMLGSSALAEPLLKAGMRTVFVEDPPHLIVAPPQCVQRLTFIRPGSCALDRTENAHMTTSYDDALHALKTREPAIDIFWTEPIFCGTGRCLAQDASQWLYTDRHHLSIHGADVLLRQMQQSGYFNGVARP